MAVVKLLQSLSIADSSLVSGSSTAAVTLAQRVINPSLRNCPRDVDGMSKWEYLAAHPLFGRLVLRINT